MSLQSNIIGWRCRPINYVGTNVEYVWTVAATWLKDGNLKVATVTTAGVPQVFDFLDLEYLPHREPVDDWLASDE